MSIMLKLMVVGGKCISVQRVADQRIQEVARKDRKERKERKDDDVEYWLIGG